jgi:hypothetical protein
MAKCRLRPDDRRRRFAQHWAMSIRASLPAVGVLNVAAILAFGAMIVIQIAGGVDNYPTIPPGLVISIVVAAVVVLGAKWWWTSLFGAVWPAFLSVGAILAGATADNLGHPGDGFVFVTTLLQMAALATALVSGLLFAAGRYRNRVSSPAPV